MNPAAIFYIEDEPDYQLLVTRTLEPAGFKVTCADTGEQGLEQLARQNPSLLILDINLPDTNGYELCRHIRQQEIWADLRILMLTVRRRPNEWLEGFSAGGDDYLAKPFNPAELIERVRCYVNGRPARRLDPDKP